MLFDEKDLRIFDNEDSRKYFQEILQSYYSQNYRATVVLLYSFVIYDLYIKLKTMASEGDSKAANKLKDIKKMIADDKKYSEVEAAVVQFYVDNCPLYFDRFIDDVDYLKNCRNKCAHLKVNDDSLYVPSDYHARMLICSMFDNVFSVKAPFIMDLFSVVQPDIEKYTNQFPYVPKKRELEEGIIGELSRKYFSRMTYDAIKKSYVTFIKLLLISTDEKARENACGLYVFTYALTNYIIKKGYLQFFSESSIIAIFSKIEKTELENNKARRNALIWLMIDYPVIMDLIRSKNEFFDYLSHAVVDKCEGLEYYKAFFPRDDKSTFEYFKETNSLHIASQTNLLYNTLSKLEQFDANIFFETLVSAIPSYCGYDAADAYMSVFLEHMQDLRLEDVKNIKRIYSSNNQCTGRGRHAFDIAVVNKYLEEHDVGNTTEGNE